MLLKKMVLALALASLTGIAWLGLSASPAAAASPAAQLTKFDKEIGLSAKAGHKHGKAGHKHGKASHKHGKAGHKHSTAGHKHGKGGHKHGKGGHKHGKGGHKHGRNKS